MNFPYIYAVKRNGNGHCWRATRTGINLTVTEMSSSGGFPLAGCPPDIFRTFHASEKLKFKSSVPAMAP